MSNFQKRVYEIVSLIPQGEVLTYAEVARRAGSPGAARAVGNLMNLNPFPKDRVPCHRVVRSDGLVGGYANGPKTKIALLRREGIRIHNGRILSNPVTKST